MNITGNIMLNLYSIIFLILLYIHSENLSVNSKLFIDTIRITILLLVFDILGRFDGNPGSFYPVINQTGDFLLFLLSPILPSFWVLYVHLQLFHKEQKTKKLMYLLIIINALHGILVIFNLFFGYFYTIDQQNVYSRGPLFLVSTLFSISLLLTASILVLVNHQKTKANHYYSLLFFIVPPTIGIILQIFFYGYSLVLNGVVFSILIIFLNIQNKSIYTDHLTGIYNRKMLDKYLTEKIEKSTVEKTFSAIMLDLNNFKKINDSYGHDIGDHELQNTVKILKSAIKSSDLLARFGGDEFWIILNTCDLMELKEIIDKINFALSKYNDSNLKPYRLAFSMGYSVYHYESHMTIEAFQKYLDALMYVDKNKNQLK